jgi:hypothetical protein
MTPPHNNPQGTTGSEHPARKPQQEYIITEEQLHSLEVCGGNTDCDGCEYSAPGFRCTPGMVASDIRSRTHTSAPAPDTKVDNFKRLAEEHHKLCIEIHNFDNHIHDVIQKGIRICESKYEGEDSINCCNCGVPTTDDGEPDCNECAFSEQHDTAIRAEAAKAEREDVLKELTEKFSELRHEGWNLWKGQEAIDELLGKQPNPCEENGCTDIENCDEICDNRRIYSPVQVAEKVKAAREQDIKILEDYRNSLDYPDCPPGDTIKRLIQSLRQPEPQQEGRR